jgi:adenine phosphoribosyltransferase
MKLNILKKSLEDAPIIKKGEYKYVIHPITDGIPEIKPNLLEEISLEMKKIIDDIGKIDKIVTIEAMGIPLATSLSLKTNIPFTIIRKRKYNIPDEICVEQITGYSKSNLYINGLKKGDKIVIVDDVLSTGGTLLALLSSLDKIGVIVKCVIIAVDKGNNVKKLMDKTNVNIFTLAHIDVFNNKIKIKNL